MDWCLGTDVPECIDLFVLIHLSGGDVLVKDLVEDGRLLSHGKDILIIRMR